MTNEKEDEGMEIKFNRSYQLTAHQIIPEYDRMLDILLEQINGNNILSEENQKQVLKINELSKEIEELKKDVSKHQEALHKDKQPEVISPPAKAIEKSK